ncbi:MAG: hypothetical protein IJS63_06575 [Bacteroidaceae bacterium]|nr:hypothetical protein [Bacteroidaceae bacterium]
MKKIYMTMVALLCGVAAMAQNELYADAVDNVKAGEGFNLVLKMKNTDPITAIAFKVNVPDGIKAKAVKNFTFNEERIDVQKVQLFLDDEEAEAGDMYSFSRRNVSGSTDYQYEFTPQTAGRDEAGTWNSLYILGNDGDMITIPFTVEATVAEGVYEIKFYDISLADTQPTAQSVATATELVVKVGVGVTVGINSINADDVNAPIYNIAGQRVSKAQKGVYIQNGKKVAVK